MRYNAGMKTPFRNPCRLPHLPHRLVCLPHRLACLPHRLACLSRLSLCLTHLPRRRWRHLSAPALLLAALLPALPVGAATGAPGTIWQSGGEYVRLVERGGARGARNDHPAKIAPKTLAAILTGLKVAPADDKPSDTVANIELSRTISLFSPAAAQRFGKALSIALNKAKPDQDIAFQGKDNTSLVGFVKKPVHTTGRLFWKGGRLHIIFGSVHKGIVKRWIFGRETGLANPPRAAERGTTPARPGYRVALTPGVRHAKTRGGKTRTDWIVIDPDIALAPPAGEPATPVRAAGARGEDRQSLENRLRRLKKLRRDGLITERAYQRKVRAILDEL